MINCTQYNSIDQEIINLLKGRRFEILYVRIYEYTIYDDLGENVAVTFDGVVNVMRNFYIYMLVWYGWRKSFSTAQFTGSHLGLGDAITKHKIHNDFILFGSTICLALCFSLCKHRIEDLVRITMIGTQTRWRTTLLVIRAGESRHLNTLLSFGKQTTQRLALADTSLGY